MVVATAAGASGALLGPAAASNAQGGAITPDLIQQQCAIQYPAGGNYRAGTAYLASPNDPYSWRCRQQSNSSTSGVFTDLAVDLGAICATHGGGRPQAGDGPYNWTCG